MIKFNLINSYTENLFFFVSNLSEFHFSCRKGYNQEWQKIFGKITSREKNALKKIKPIFKKYGFGGKHIYWGIPVFTSSEDDKIKSLKKILSEKEFLTLEEALRILEVKFKKVYQKNKVDEWIKIQTEIFKSDRIQNAVKEIKSLLGADFSMKKINVHLLGFVSSRALAAGGANLGSRDITLEMPLNRVEDWIGEWGVFVALHELAHIFFENSKARRILEEKIKKESIDKIARIKPRRDLYNLMKEIVVVLCAPSGYICEKNSRKIKPLSEMLITNLGGKLEQFERYKNNKDVLYHDLSSYIIWQTYPLVSFYVNRQKIIDSNFIDKLLKILKAGD